MKRDASATIVEAYSETRLGIHFDEQLPWHELKMANAKFLGSDVAIVLGFRLYG